MILDRARSLAMHASPTGGLWLAPADIKELRAVTGTIERLMLELIPLAAELAQPHLSGFRVGAVVLGSSGGLYFGGNAELDDSTTAQTIHAEQAAVVNAILHGEIGIEKLAVSAAPCGYCRQFLNELASAERLQILLADRPAFALAGLLPAAFGPRDLGVEGGSPTTVPILLDWIEPGPGAAAGAALTAARLSYAPYTHSWAGVGLVLRHRSPNGETVSQTIAGPYLENAAFNPSLSPLQTALIGLITAGRSCTDICEAALVQVADAKIAHADAVQALWRRLVPALPLPVYMVRLVEVGSIRQAPQP